MLNSSQNLLAIDTATGNFSIALFKGGEAVELFVSDLANKQVENLIPEIEALLSRHGLEYADLSYIAVNIGPGSFTGLRIGLAAVKAWQLVLPAQAIAVTSLEAAAMQKGGGKVTLDARRGQAYVQEFDSDSKPISEPSLQDYGGEFDDTANAEWIAKVAMAKLANGADLGEIKPLYIRDADAKKPSK